MQQQQQQQQQQAQQEICRNITCGHWQAEEQQYTLSPPSLRLTALK